MNRQYSTEQVEYTAGQYDSNGVVLEGYNPADYEHDMPYMASGRYQQRPPQPQQYYQNPGQMPQYGQQPPQGYGQPNIQGLNYQQEQNQRAAGPSYNDAQRNLERYDNMLNNLGHVNVTRDDSDVQEYALGVAMESLHSAIKALREVDYWIPKGKESLAPKFTQAAAPVLKGLHAYLAAMERIQ